MLKTAIIGASGYTGAQLVTWVSKHPKLSLSDLYVSDHSDRLNQPISAVYGELAGLVDLRLQPIAELERTLAEKAIILLATEHEISHQLLPKLSQSQAQIYDLSGAFRLSDLDVFAHFYGFKHKQHALNDLAAYGLAEWNQAQIKTSKFIAVPGCYPTASLLALKPLQQDNLLDTQCKPVINAVSGVSGAGRKAKLNNSFCEVSLQPYGVFNHRHLPEIEQELGINVIFNPHLGAFKRGILATITAKLKPSISDEQIKQSYLKAYQGQKLIRLSAQWPRLDHVVGTPFADIGWQRDGDYLVVVCAIDNLLKGAATQAIQCINLHNDFDPVAGLL